MDTRRRVALSVVVWAVLMAGPGRPDASGQSLGTFRWQFFPFCNVVTLSVVQEGAAFMLAGSDNQCSGTTLAAATGTAFNNPNGTIGMGLTIVPPGGVPVSAAIVLNAITLSGTWTDDAGNTGEFRFNPSTVAGSPRPAGSPLITGTQIAPGAVNTGAIADGTIGVVDVNPAQVQQRVTGSCAAGQFMRAINQDGTVTCAAEAPGAIVSAQLADGAVTGPKLAADAVDGSKIADGSVGAADVNAAEVQLTLQGSCAAGLFLQAVNADGTLVCTDGAAVVATNTALGNNALANATGTSNTAVGDGALDANTTGSENTAVGRSALGNNTSSNQNTAIGNGALLNTTTGQNTAVGHNAMMANQTGSGNTAMGLAALPDNVSGSRNTAIGRGALFLATASDNIALGFQAGENQSTGSNGIYVGNVGGAAESNTIRIGTVAATVNHPAHTAAFIAGISGVNVGAQPAVLVNAAGQLGINASSARFKEDIRPLGQASGGLLRLRPVSFRYRDATAAERQVGLIAEEVAEVLPELVYYGPDGRAQTVLYHVLPTLLLNELQRQERELAALRAELAELRARFGALGAPRQAARADE